MLLSYIFSVWGGEGGGVGGVALCLYNAFHSMGHIYIIGFDNLCKLSPKFCMNEFYLACRESRRKKGNLFSIKDYTLCIELWLSDIFTRNVVLIPYLTLLPLCFSKILEKTCSKIRIHLLKVCFKNKISRRLI